MKKVCVVSTELNNDHVKRIQDTCSDVGFEFAFFEDGEKALSEVADAEIAYCSWSTGVIPQMTNLEWVQSPYAGIEPYLKSGLFDSGKIILTNSAGAYALAIAEHVVMVALMLMRQMPEYLRIVAERGWEQRLPIRSIEGCKVAIAGTGGVGSLTAQKLKAMGAAEVNGFNRSGRDAEGFDHIYRISEIDDKLDYIDILVMCMPETPETVGFLNEERIGRLPESAYLINVGRGSAVDQDALIAALNEGRLAGAALDVVYPEPLPKDHPLWDAKNCIITPHSSGDTGLPYSVDCTVEQFCENLRRYAKGEELINVVDVERGY